MNFAMVRTELYRFLSESIFEKKLDKSNTLLAELLLI